MVTHLAWTASLESLASLAARTIVVVTRPRGLLVSTPCRLVTELTPCRTVDVARATACWSVRVVVACRSTLIAFTGITISAPWITCVNQRLFNWIIVLISLQCGRLSRLQEGENGQLKLVVEIETGSSIAIWRCLFFQTSNTYLSAVDWFVWTKFGLLIDIDLLKWATLPTRNRK